MPDSDSDGLKDGAEIYTYGTNVNLADTDGDGLSDGTEVNTTLTDPLRMTLNLIINSVIVTEPASSDSGTTQARLTVTLRGDDGTREVSVRVQYSTADGTARASNPDRDYVSIALSSSNALNFPVGTSEKEIVVEVNGDNNVESLETFYVNLSTPLDAIIAPNYERGTVSIMDQNS
jgi:hypothetical protein